MTFLNNWLNDWIDGFIFWLDGGMFSVWLNEFFEWVNDWLTVVLTPPVSQKSYSSIQSVRQSFIQVSETYRQSIIQKSHSVIHLDRHQYNQSFIPIHSSSHDPTTQSENTFIYSDNRTFKKDNYSFSQLIINQPFS